MTATYDFEIDTRSHMVCGYCGDEDHFTRWPPVPMWLALGYLELTGFHTLGVGQNDGQVVVLVEARDLWGAVHHIPHLCEKIPAEVLAEYAGEIDKARAGAL